MRVKDLKDLLDGLPDDAEIMAATEDTKIISFEIEDVGWRPDYNAYLLWLV